MGSLFFMMKNWWWWWWWWWLCIGSGFISSNMYQHGFYSSMIKLPADYTAGVVVAFYVSRRPFIFICLITIKWFLYKNSSLFFWEVVSFIVVLHDCYFFFTFWPECFIIIVLDHEFNTFDLIIQLLFCFVLFIMC